MSIEAYYTQHVKIIRVDRTSDSLGRWTEATTVLIDDYPCSIQPKAPREYVLHDRDSVRRTHMMYGAVVEEMEEANRVVDGTDTYNVLSVRNPVNMNRFLTVELEAIR